MPAYMEDIYLEDSTSFPAGVSPTTSLSNRFQICNPELVSRDEITREGGGVEMEVQAS